MIVIVANLKPVVLRGEESNGMLLAASNEDGSVIILSVENDKVQSGTKLT